jgi:hypothetical protein
VTGSNEKAVAAHTGTAVPSGKHSPKPTKTTHLNKNAYDRLIIQLPLITASDEAPFTSWLSQLFLLL